MNGTRIVYLSSVLSAVLFYIYDSEYFSWILLLVILLLPGIAFLLSLPIFLSSSLRVNCDQKMVAAGSGFDIHVSLASKIPLCPARAQLKFTNRFTGRVQKTTLFLRPGSPPVRIRCTDDLCGVVDVSVQYFRIIDLAGLFFFPRKNNDTLSILMYPEEIPFTGKKEDFPPSQTPIAEQPIASTMKLEREPWDTREYRDGDLLRDVHWKLSAKSDKIMLREFKYFASESLQLGLIWIGDPPMLSRSLGRLIGVLAETFASDEPLSLFFVRANPDTGSSCLESYTINNEDQISEIIWDLLSCTAAAQGDSAMNLLFSDDRNQGVFLLSGPDDTTLYENGEKCEVFL